MFKIKLLYFITNFLFLNFLQDYSEQQFFLHPVCGHKFAQLRKTLVYVQTILFLLWNLCAGYEHDYRSISRHQSLRPWCSVVANLIGLCLAVFATYSLFVLAHFYLISCTVLDCSQLFWAYKLRWELSVWTNTSRYIE